MDLNFEYLLTYNFKKFFKEILFGLLLVIAKRKKNIISV